MGCDFYYCSAFISDSVVSIHAPRVGCDIRCYRYLGIHHKFQFTHPVWGATTGFAGGLRVIQFQFTHPVWGATASKMLQGFSIKFQFTHPVWGATVAQGCGTYANERFNSRTPCGVRLLVGK